MRPLPTEVDRLAARQYGLVAVSQLLPMMTESEIRGRIGSGHFIPVARGVVRLAGVAGSWRQRGMAACLASGWARGGVVALSHTAAARVWGLDGVACHEIEVSVPRHRSGRTGLRVPWRTHRTRLGDGQIVERMGLPVTSLSRTFADLAGVVSPAVVARALDDCVRRHLLSPGDLAHITAPAFGRTGAAQLRRIVTRRLEDGVGDSEAEDRVLHWLVGAGLPRPERQVRVDTAEMTCLLDYGYPAVKVGIEYQGFSYHGRQASRFDADAARHTALAVEGWLMIFVTSESVPAVIVDAVRRALLQRGGF